MLFHYLVATYLRDRNFTCSFSFYYIVQLSSGYRCPLSTVVINFLFHKSGTDEAAVTFSERAITLFMFKPLPANVENMVSSE